MSKKISFYNVLSVVTLSSFLMVLTALAWTEPTVPPPGNNVSAPINVGTVEQVKNGALEIRGIFKVFSNAIFNGNVGIKNTNPTKPLDVAGDANATRLCIAGVCREGWPDAPLSNLNKFTAGHLYPVPAYIPVDVYQRNSSYPFPYITLKKAISIVGIDSTDPITPNKVTNWFGMGYSYMQPYTLQSSALFVEEGDNSSPRNHYVKYGPPGDNWKHNNDDDPFAFGFFIDKNGRKRSVDNGSGQEQFIDNCIIGIEPTCDHVIEKRYADSTSSKKGRVLLEIKVVPGQQQNGLCVYDKYFRTMLLGSWGSPLVSVLRITPYSDPNLDSDEDGTIDPEACADKNLNLHSKIVGRFKVFDAYKLVADPIENFENEDFTYMIKEIGIAYLKFITKDIKNEK